MRRWIGIAFIGLLVLPTAGTWMFLSLKRMEWKAMVYEQLMHDLSPEQLTTIQIISGQAEVQWVEDHEFRYNGHWYDVVRKEQNGDTIRYVCVADSYEDDIEKKLEDLMATSDQPNGQKPLTVRLLDLLNHQWLEPDCNIFTLLSLAQTENRPDYRMVFLSFEGLSPDVPPPDARC